MQGLLESAVHRKGACCVRWGGVGALAQARPGLLPDTRPLPPPGPPLSPRARALDACGALGRCPCPPPGALPHWCELKQRRALIQDATESDSLTTIGWAAGSDADSDSVPPGGIRSLSRSNGPTPCCGRHRLPALSCASGCSREVLAHVFHLPIEQRPANQAPGQKRLIGGVGATGHAMEPKQLLDPLEEQFHLPARVERGQREVRQPVLVHGDKVKRTDDVARSRNGSESSLRGGDHCAVVLEHGAA